jgi:hypothetical protein
MDPFSAGMELRAEKIYIMVELMQDSAPGPEIYGPAAAPGPMAEAPLPAVAEFPPPPPPPPATATAPAPASSTFASAPPTATVAATAITTTCQSVFWRRQCWRDCWRGGRRLGGRSRWVAGAFRIAWRPMCLCGSGCKLLQLVPTHMEYLAGRLQALHLLRCGCTGAARPGLTRWTISPTRSRKISLQSPQAGAVQSNAVQIHRMLTLALC